MKSTFKLFPLKFNYIIILIINLLLEYILNNHIIIYDILIIILQVINISLYIIFIVKLFRAKTIRDREYWKDYRILIRILFIYIKYSLFSLRLFILFSQRSKLDFIYYYYLSLLLNRYVIAFRANIIRLAII